MKSNKYKYAVDKPVFFPILSTSAVDRKKQFRRLQKKGKEKGPLPAVLLLIN